MPPHVDDDEEFGISSGDEADLVTLTDFVEHGIKRRISDENLPAAKRVANITKDFPSATKALMDNFGMKEFRLKQKQVISRILSGGNAAVVFPTGGGKSLCYQIPALVFSEEDKILGIRGERESGITLVVSPLIALMKDQVDALVKRGIKAATLDSTKTHVEYLKTCEMLRNGELKLLYCAPERLNNEGFVEKMKYVRGGIRLLAVDEAHCISEWGHAFRPDYLKISRFVNEIKAERVICLTATATKRVATDICRAFNIDDDGVFRTSTYRPNLRLIAESARSKQKIYPMLFKFLRENPGASIVYVTLQKQTEALAIDLRAQGFNAKSFHAGMNTAVKTELQDEFMKRDDLIMVATIAFGMGIDKASIRNVVHFNIPSSLESYSQEIGRAGRDGKISNCVFYVCGEDLHLREIFARGDLPSRESVRKLLGEIFDIENPAPPILSDIKFSHSHQEKEFDIRSTTLKNIYAQLELAHNLIRATTPIYTKYSFRDSPQYKTMMARDNTPAGIAIRTYATKASTLHNIDVEASAARCGTPRIDIIHKLNDLDEAGIIELKTAGVLKVYKVLQSFPRTSTEINKLAKDIYTTMEKREQEALDRTEEMIRLITAEACFSRSLAQHFGDDLPGGSKECGHCTWCLTHKAVVQKSPPQVELNTTAFKTILDLVPARDDARLLARIAFGITSPRVTALKLSKHPIFGSMDNHNFMDLLCAFTSECSKANQRL